MSANVESSAPIDWSIRVQPLDAKKIAKDLKNNLIPTRSLNLRGSSLGIYAVRLCKSLKTNTTLTSLDLSSTMTAHYTWSIPAIAEALVQNTTLSILNLNNTEINQTELVLIPLALKVNSTLTSLDLGTSWIRECDTKAFAQALETNTTLTSLNFHPICKTHDIPQEETLQTIEAALQRNRDLKA